MRALVIKSTGLWYEVMANQKRLVARLRGKFKLDDKKLTNPLAVGDWVEVTPNEQVNNEWVITKIYDRDNYVVRTSTRKKGHDHLIASNIDQGVLIVTLKRPRTSMGFVDRFLIALESFRIPGVILFNKEDIYSTKELNKFDELKGVYQKIGYTVALCHFEEGVSENVRSLFENKTSLLSGHSGAGKSTLINQLIPEASQEVNEVSDFANKGVHTTTFAELFYLDDKSAIIDTPGIKELGLSDIEEDELSHYFPEMRNYLGQCKFHNCLHTNEPGCVVRDAIGKDISELRYQSYLSILKNQDERK
ncbi:ribosome small subunit-dependent GTPase A [Ekhidna sp.]|uniref:ribosome small subunit-dependent GTPase A n=1 Tax=Ekhidna sp. TaxID=2608089 RepID=UPI003BA87EFD